MRPEPSPVVKPLTELRWATQFLSNPTRKKFLYECIDVTGGITFFRAHALEYLYIGCDSPTVEDQVRGIVKRFEPQTVSGFLPVQSPGRGVGFVLPKESNEVGKSRKRLPLYDKTTRERLLALVSGRFGQHQLWECDGYWVKEGRAIQDHSDYVFFPDTTLSWHGQLGGPANTVVLPRKWFRETLERLFIKGMPMGAEVRMTDGRRSFTAFLCDQDAYYFSGGGKSEVVDAIILDKWLHAAPNRQVSPAQARHTSRTR